MSFTLIAHTGAQSPDGNTVTTTGIDTTGATLIVAAVAQVHGVAFSFTDSLSNIWTGLTVQDNASSPKIQIFYVVNPNVGAGHTFANIVTSSFPAVTVTAWTGNAASPFDVENGSTASATTIATGNVTPSLTNALVITAAGHSEVYSSSVDSSLTISDNEAGASSLAFGLAMAYIVQTVSPPATVNTTWSGDGSTHGWAAAIAVFKSADGVVPTIGAAASPFYRIKGWKYYSYARGL